MSAFRTTLRRFGIGRSAPPIVPTGPVEPYSRYRPLWPTAAEAVRKNIALFEQLGVAELGCIDVEALVSQHQPKHWDGAMDQTLEVLCEWMVEEDVAMPRLVALPVEAPRSCDAVLVLVSRLSAMDGLGPVTVRTCRHYPSSDTEPERYVLAFEGHARHEIVFRNQPSDDIDMNTMRDLLQAFATEPGGDRMAATDTTDGVLVMLVDDDGLEAINVRTGSTDKRPILHRPSDLWLG